MKRNRIFLSAMILAAAAACQAQSDGRAFDAAVVLTPGFHLERGGVLFSNSYQSGLLQHGDVLYTANAGRSGYHILTSDGTVIGLSAGTTMVIDGRQVGFNVFRVVRGAASILGNINEGYPLPPEFSYGRPYRIGTIIVQPPVYPDPIPVGGGTLIVPAWNW